MRGAMVTGREQVGPGWVPRQLSEIKPGAFTSSRAGRAVEELPGAAERRRAATTDPLYRHIKRLLPKQRNQAGQS